MEPRSTYPTLKNAPITEAVIDLRVGSSLSITSDLLQRCRDELAPSFPKIEEQRKVEGLFELIDGGGVRQSMSDHGIRRLVMKSEDRGEAVIISDTEFAFSKLRPYTDWAHVFSSAKEFWAIYARCLKVEVLTRLAVRYINHFAIPRGSSLSDYLEAPAGLPVGVGVVEVQEVFGRLALRDPRTDIDSVVLQAISFASGEATVVLDIDASLSGSFAATEEIWSHFEELRSAKNRIFFGSITRHAEREFDR
jgi:uncharacterized protein (TIGR04255 family)